MTNKKRPVARARAHDEGPDERYSKGMTSAKGTVLEWCDECDGCGWVEGGKVLKTTCSRCNGTGKVRTTRIKADAPAETTMKAGERDAATIGNFLIKRGWRLVEDSGPWCWQEPGTRARYKVKDAIAIASRQPSKGKRRTS